MILMHVFTNIFNNIFLSLESKHQRKLNYQKVNIINRIYGQLKTFTIY
jgi:hypothetical protein